MDISSFLEEHLVSWKEKLVAFNVIFVDTIVTSGTTIVGASKFLEAFIDSSRGNKLIDGFVKIEDSENIGMWKEGRLKKVLYSLNTICQETQSLFPMGS